MASANLGGTGGDLCLTMVELRLAQSSCDPGGLSIVESGGCRDLAHGSYGIDPLADRADNDVCGSNITYCLPYLTQQPDCTEQTNCLPDIDLDYLTTVDNASILSHVESGDPVSALSSSNSAELDCIATMPSSAVGSTTTSDKVVKVVQ